MALGNDKTRILVNIPLDLKEKIEVQARQENRSVSNYIVTILQKEIERIEFQEE
jgi:hypothetical protein